MGFYNEKHIGTKARSSKTCDWCGKLIPKETPHYVLVDMESYCQYPIHEKCYKEADDKCHGNMEKFVNYVKDNY